MCLVDGLLNLNERAQPKQYSFSSNDTLSIMYMIYSKRPLWGHHQRSGTSFTWPRCLRVRSRSIGCSEKKGKMSEKESIKNVMVTCCLMNSNGPFFLLLCSSPVFCRAVNFIVNPADLNSYCTSDCSCNCTILFVLTNVCEVNKKDSKLTADTHGDKLGFCCCAC